ncbi:hypothetical protein Pmani_010411 [Petrolisthes manimaculis]|uniref:Uncharacterized protein n=1 Tax=Petrolisthes manimaculis TaxID=1843537 RepID=A0AAE1UGT4_9EUCA|nr:hypothetical protein Pmani_010411 [Petrolisthes manimaculis]
MASRKIMAEDELKDMMNSTALSDILDRGQSSDKEGSDCEVNDVVMEASDDDDDSVVDKPYEPSDTSSGSESDEIVRAHKKRRISTPAKRGANAGDLPLFPIPPYPDIDDPDVAGPSGLQPSPTPVSATPAEHAGEKSIFLVSKF